MNDKLWSAVKASKVAAAKAADLAIKANRALPKARANEIRITTAGGIIGAVGGATLIGGMGLAALGTAVPVAGALAVGAVGVAAGNKIGSEIDRWKLSRQNSSDEKGAVE
ncbi:hypothetical protein [Agrobacterium sp. NPDC089420]|uniref:hypothetical protein n=1 Tax=Agrobacterium sp. NPDC089420 TaxID=3363918 RepID=UPI00384CD2C8